MPKPESKDAELPLESFFGGFTRGPGTVHPRTKAVRLDVFPGLVRISPRSRSRLASILIPQWEARYDELRPIRVVRRRPAVFYIRFERTGGGEYRFRPWSDDLMHDAAEPVLVALRRSGAPIAD